MMRFKLLIVITSALHTHITHGFSPSSITTTTSIPQHSHNGLLSPSTTLTLNTHHRRSLSRRNLSIMKSAKILPIVYTSASAALAYQAKLATSKGDAAFLLATSALTLFNLGPTDNARLISAKRADINNPPAVSGVAKQRRQAAKTWQSTVRIKLVGQLMGLSWMIHNCFKGNVNGQLRGGAMVMGANMAFFFCGGGGTVHNARGDHEPMPSGLTKSILMIDTILTLSALLAARAPIDSGRRAIFRGIYIAGVSMGALEGLAGLLKNIANTRHEIL